MFSHHFSNFIFLYHFIAFTESHPEPSKQVVISEVNLELPVINKPKSQAGRSLPDIYHDSQGKASNIYAWFSNSAHELC